MSGERSSPQVAILEHRAEQRYLCDENVTCILPITNQRFWSQVKNLSKIGAGLVTDLPLDTGTSLIIEVPKSDHAAALSIRATVVRRIPYSRESWFLGCRFGSPLSEREFHNLLDRWSEPQTQPSGAEEGSDDVAVKT
jgi:hypothetical protein